jgi:sec-independent protein translocase protein TatA
MPSKGTKPRYRVDAPKAYCRNMPVLGEIIGWEFLLVLLIILVLFGSSQLPKLARSLGQASREFRKGAHEEDTPPDDPPPAH